MKRWGGLLFVLLVLSGAAHAFKSFENVGGAVHAGILRQALGTEVTPEVLGILVDACNTQDYVESHNFGDPTHHCDNSLFRESRQYMQGQWKQALFFAARCNEELPMRDGALRELGLLLHAAQDFYSHSNYVELQLQDLVKPDDIQPVEWSRMPAGVRSGYFFYKNPTNSELNRSRAACIEGLLEEFPGLKFASDREVQLMAGSPRTFEGALALATSGFELLHYDLNKDGPKELQGAVVHPASGLTLHEIARRAAVRETRRVWDELGREIARKHGKAAPVLMAVLSGRQRPGAVALPETAPPLELTLNGPSELTSGQQAMFTVSARGAQGRLRYQWTTSWGKAGTADSLHETFVSPATYSVAVQVTDEGRPGDAPAEARTTLLVHPPLSGTLEGPDRGEPGHPLLVTARVQGGKPPYSYRWSVHDQPVGQDSPTLSGTLRGNPGQEFRLQVEVRDSLAAVLKLDKPILLMGQPEVVIEKVTVEPAQIPPGGQARVTVRFVARNFGQDPVVTARVRLWLEMSSGSGQGLDHVFEVSVPQGNAAAYWGEFHLPDPTTPGPLRAEGTVTVGGITRTGTAVAHAGRPGGLQDVTVDSRVVAVEIWDHGTLDGDIVTVKLNGMPLLSGVTLGDQPHRLSLSLRPGANLVEVYAHNEGNSPPNTAALRLSNVVQGPAQQQYTLKAGVTGHFQIVAP